MLGSSDSGASWGLVTRVGSVEHAAYSALAPINETHVALVYERGVYRYLTTELLVISHGPREHPEPTGPFVLPSCHSQDYTRKRILALMDQPKAVEEPKPARVVQLGAAGASPQQMAVFWLSLPWHWAGWWYWWWLWASVLGHF